VRWLMIYGRICTTPSMQGGSRGKRVGEVVFSKGACSAIPLDKPNARRCI
jgi:hypothetical protein